MHEGKVRTAARTKGFDSLAQVANELVGQRPELFSGVAPRSLGAKLSDLDRGNVTWWRTREQQLEALGALLALDTKELVAAEQARRQGLWVFREFPELPALDLMTERPPTITDPAPAPDEVDHFNDWMRIGTGSEHEQRPFHRLGSEVRWLTVPKGTGRCLLLAQFQARNRIEVYEGKTLSELVSRVHPLRPAVLAPQSATPQDISELAKLNQQQPVLVISAHPSPRNSPSDPKQSIFPSWEWLSAPQQKRDKSRLTKDESRISGGAFHNDQLMKSNELHLKPEWRSILLDWIEDRLRHKDSLFSAKGLTAWLEKFDPDEVLFPTPAAVMSLARICHDVGENKLPEPARPDAGEHLIKQLSGTDSRYLSLLRRLVARQWLDASTGIQEGRSWDDWLTTPQAKSSAADPKDTYDLTSFDLDAAKKYDLLVPNGDGHYEIRSQAEAMLALRDLLRGWLQSGDITKWAPAVVGDELRQKLADHLLTTIDNWGLVFICKQIIQQPVWDLASLGASETLFITIGLRMAAGTLSYHPEFGELLAKILERCISDSTPISLPLSRSHGDLNEWIHASWGWSLVAPKPKWVPRCMKNAFPGWASEKVNWLNSLSIPIGRDTRLRDADFRRLQAAVNTATKVLRIVDLPEDTYTSEALIAVVSLLHATQNGLAIDMAWWQAATNSNWSREILSTSFAGFSSTARHRLAVSMLEACVEMHPSSLLNIFSLVHDRIWLLLLGTVDSVALCKDLSPNAINFLACNASTIPSHLRQAAFDKLDPTSLPPDLDWAALIGAAVPPSDAWLNTALTALLSSLDLRSADHLIAVLWEKHPQICLPKAIDTEDTHHSSFRDGCPPEWTAELGIAMAQAAIPADDLYGTAHWATDRIASSGQHAQVLIDLLSSVAAVVSVSPSTK